MSRSESVWAEIFSTHPPVKRRLDALLGGKVVVLRAGGEILNLVLDIYIQLIQLFLHLNELRMRRAVSGRRLGIVNLELALLSPQGLNQ